MSSSTTSFRKLVVKVGTNVLTRADGRLDVTNISQLVDQLAELRRRKVDVVLITSGAVGAGRALVPSAEQLDPVVRRQMLSAVGQIHLMELYRQLFAGHGLLCGQVLTTKEDFRDRSHYLNMRNCLGALLQGGIIPIVNENDVVSVTELMFTDNDELAGLLAAMIDADALVILSSVDGLYDGLPGAPDSRLIEEVLVDDEQVLEHIAPVKSSFGRGGMSTKLRMAQQTARLGTEVFLANGRRSGILLDLVSGNFIGTRIRARERVSSVKKWLAHHRASKADVHVNDGAARALTDSARVSSLLPIGITAIDGDFEKGDLLRILDPAGQPIALGKAQYGVATARQYMGEQGKRALVHYDYLVLIGGR